MLFSFFKKIHLPVTPRQQEQIRSAFLTMVGNKERSFYAVGQGRVRGVYLTWNECQSQINGYRNAKYKKFSTFDEADAFVKQYSSPESKAMAAAARNHFATQAVSQARTNSASTSTQIASAALHSFGAAAVPKIESVPLPQPSAELDETYRVKKRPTSMEEAPSAKSARKNLMDIPTFPRRPIKSEPVSQIAEPLAGPSTHPVRHCTQSSANTSAVIGGARRAIKMEPVSQIEEPQDRPQPIVDSLVEPLDVPLRANDQQVNNLTEVREELQRLKDHISKLEDELKEIVQNFQFKTDELAVLRAQVASFERRINQEAGNQISLQDTVNRIKIHGTPQRRTQLIETPASSSQQPSEPADETDSQTENENRLWYDNDNYCIVYTDGCCRNNGKPNAKAGLGVYFGDGFKYNLKEPLQGYRPTNNNAEIMAAAMACSISRVIEIEKINIHTDSEFVIKCVNQWMPTWERNGWLTASKKPVENKDALLALKNAMQGLQIKWTYVPGHSNIHGNEMADRFANEGAEKYVPEKPN